MPKAAEFLPACKLRQPCGGEAILGQLPASPHRPVTARWMGARRRRPVLLSLSSSSAQLGRNERTRCLERTRGGADSEWRSVVLPPRLLNKKGRYQSFINATVGGLYLYMPRHRCQRSIMPPNRCLRPICRRQQHTHGRAHRPSSPSLRSMQVRSSYVGVGGTKVSNWLNFRVSPALKASTSSQTSQYIPVEPQRCCNDHTLYLPHRRPLPPTTTDLPLHHLNPAQTRIALRKVCFEVCVAGRAIKSLSASAGAIDVSGRPRRQCRTPRVHGSATAPGRRVFRYAFQVFR